MSGCVFFMSFFFVCSSIMDNFTVSEDEDCPELFITQSSRIDGRDNVVSLEENREFHTISDPKYSDISDVEEENAMKGD